jgi:LuxR family maltose regulon positive regulatory protein
VEQGRYDEVEDWIDGASDEASGPQSLSALYDLITHARLRVARFDGGKASVHEMEPLLQQIRDAAERAGSRGSLIEVLLLKLRMAVALGEEERAPELMDEALDLARPEGLFLVFLQDRQALGEWFRHAALRHPECALARRLSAAGTEAALLQTGAAGARQPASPLTPREVDILRLMAAGLTNKEIARRCFISVSTVKRHAANIYVKLEVSNRTLAAARADELGLL